MSRELATQLARKLGILTKSAPGLQVRGSEVPGTPIRMRIRDIAVPSRAPAVLSIEVSLFGAHGSHRPPYGFAGTRRQQARGGKDRPKPLRTRATSTSLQIHICLDA